jgi:DNA-binding XRE family transcriptional regulator
MGFPCGDVGLLADVPPPHPITNTAVKIRQIVLNISFFIALKLPRFNYLPGRSVAGPNPEAQTFISQTPQAVESKAHLVLTGYVTYRLCTYGLRDPDDTAMALDIRIRFGRAIRRIREEQGINQEEAAERCGLHRTYYSGIERGVRNVSIVNIGKIGKGLKASLPDIFKRV